MSFRKVDVLSADQVEPGDYIGVEGFNDPVFIQSIDIVSDGYMVNFMDDYADEMTSAHILDESTVDLYVFEEDD